MQIESAEDLIQALRASGLFTPEQFEGIVRELAPFGADVPAVLKHLVRTRPRHPLSAQEDPLR